jgi:hypothetical protein
LASIISMCSLHVILLSKITRGTDFTENVSSRDVDAPTFSTQSAHRPRLNCQSYVPAAFYTHEDSWYSFLLEAECGHSAAGRITSILKSNDLIGNGTRDLPAYSLHGVELWDVGTYLGTMGRVVIEVLSLCEDALGHIRTSSFRVYFSIFVRFRSERVLWKQESRG